jgi:hypothetical protein
MANFPQKTGKMWPILWYFFTFMQNLTQEKKKAATIPFDFSLCFVD